MKTVSSPPASYDECYDAKARMVRMPFQGPGYHSRIPNGTPAHPTHPSLCYALELAQRQRPGDLARAAAIVKKVLALQDTDPVSPSYGIWPWLLEEPLTAMSPPDWNWADFCGLRLAAIFITAEKQLPLTLTRAMRSALRHAAGAIYRRNVRTHYTNICVMGGIVSVLAGEILGEERTLDYGRRRLASVVNETREVGAFNEYNSPTYTMVVLKDCELALTLTRDATARRALRWLFNRAWQTVAEHWHPATGQWAGPHSRDYQPFMTRELAAYLSSRTGARLASAADTESRVVSLTGKTSLSAAVPCPAKWRKFFTRPSPSARQLRERYALAWLNGGERFGTTWLRPEICLGTVNYDFNTNQRRALLAFWNGADGHAVALRLRFLHDGRDFSSVAFATAQDGPRALTLAYPVAGLGDFHPTLDRPADGVFYAEDFRLRYELQGANADAEEKSGALRLSAGAWTAVIQPAADSEFAGGRVRWEISRGDGWVAADAVCYHGQRRRFVFDEKLPPTALGAALWLKKTSESDQPLTVRLARDGGTAGARWNTLTVTAPERPPLWKTL